MIDNWKLILTDTLYFWYPIFLISDTLYFWYPIFLIPDIFPIPNISDTRYIWYGTWYFWYPIFIIPNINDIRYFWYFWCMNLFLMPNRGHYSAVCAIFKARILNYIQYSIIYSFNIKSLPRFWPQPPFLSQPQRSTFLKSHKSVILKARILKFYVIIDLAIIKILPLCWSSLHLVLNLGPRRSKLLKCNTSFIFEYSTLMFCCFV